ncbi:bifunctional diguanylate cyclase/phosphodiesterase [Dyella flagellata]|uniref:Bifunctional diguanylate cyclase/phosphodiesterase n=1 Tax=Dyella flagellata TaxID=1867833 RepID=A0ABQ5XGB2_9GAMM|nr:EAL domain-containing protein [Dyella flagellata]GLQ89987.1 bifunctional diguanylate cyclase/phosphodiesterase [Dyella flagellata]
MSLSLPVPVLASKEPENTVWLGCLIEAETPGEVCALIETLLHAQPHCLRAKVLMPGQAEPAGSADAQETELARDALQAADGVSLSADGRHHALVLLPAQRVVLLLSMTIEGSAKALLAKLGSYLQLGVRQLHHTIKLAELHDSHSQLEHSENLQRALFSISELSSSDVDMPDMLEEIHRIVSGLMYAENFFIVRYDAERDCMRFLYYADAQDQDKPETNRDLHMDDRQHTLTWYLLTRGKPLMGSNEQLLQQVNGPLVIAGPDSDDWLGAPILREGQVQGALVVQSYGTGIVYSREDLALLEFVGNHILTALERKESKDELERRVRQRTEELAEVNRGLRQEVRERHRAERLQEALFQVAQLATADIDENTFYERVHMVVGRLLDAKNFFIALLSDDRSKLEFPYYMDAGIRHELSRPVGRGMSEYVLRRGQPWSGTREDIIALTHAGEVIPHHIGEPSACWLGVPLKVDEAVIGLVAVQSYETQTAYGAPEQELLSFVALQIANSIYRRRSAAALHLANLRLENRVEERTRELRAEIQRREQMQQQLHHQVMHDPLTGLPNRGYLRERLDRVLNRIQSDPNRRCALLYIDIDRFKVINDSLGHLAGDEFLKAVAVRLLTHVREPDMVARLSGDEFAILLEYIENIDTATIIADRVLQAVATPLRISGKELEPSVSVGIACGDASYLDADELIRDADMALYQAKELGRKRFAVFDEALAKGMVDVLAMESELRKALRQNEFEPYFQPICRLGDGKVVGYEALIRWNHPQRGLLRPSDFVKIAEDSGLIEAIDWRLFELSCRLLTQQAPSELFITFNVSALHLRHADFDVRILKMLERTGLAPSRLVTEVTEGALLDNPESVRAVLERLRSVGVGAALDDFGTGYSSLSYLHSLPLRMLKIDRAFVQELDKAGSSNSTTVVAAILALAHALNIQVIAEGIETQAQRDALVSMGCEMAQGYLLGSPAPMAHWMAGQKT